VGPVKALIWKERALKERRKKGKGDRKRRKVPHSSGTSMQIGLIQTGLEPGSARDILRDSRRGVMQTWKGGA